MRHGAAFLAPERRARREDRTIVDGRPPRPNARSRVGSAHPLMRPAASPERATTMWRTAWGLRRFVLPHWPAMSLAMALLLGKAGVELLKPWPLKFIFDDILKHRMLEGATLYLL